MFTRVIEPPALEPVTLEEAKNFLRVDVNDDDSLIEMLIKAARKKAENYTGRAFITQTIEYGVSFIPYGHIIYLYYPPVQNIESITVDGVAVPSDKYFLSGDNALVTSLELQSKVPDGVVIRYVAGYGDIPGDVPFDIREAILKLVAYSYENREQDGMPTGAKTALYMYRVYQI